MLFKWEFEFLVWSWWARTEETWVQNLLWPWKLGRLGAALIKPLLKYLTYPISCCKSTATLRLLIDKRNWRPPQLAGDLFNVNSGHAGVGILVIVVQEGDSPKLKQAHKPCRGMRVSSTHEKRFMFPSFSFPVCYLFENFL